jgi:mono/diheme cytochrome c family protein
MTLHKTLAAFLTAIGFAAGQSTTTTWKPDIPRAWATTELLDWATPVAGLNARPSHYSEAEYYQAPVDNYRTYPVYAPGREPAGYWDMLQRIGPKPLVAPSTLRTKQDWIQAGRDVFEQADLLAQRSYDPKVIAMARSPQLLARVRYISPDGTLRLLRWVPTNRGVALGFVNCGSCHTREERDGTRWNGPPAYGEAANVLREVAAASVVANAPFALSENLSDNLYRASAVPWVEGDVHERHRTMTGKEASDLYLNALALSRGVIVRWNGSVYFPAKVPDLIGVAERKYLDHTATHLNRGLGDLMRYAALVGYAESTTFGTHEFVSAQQRRMLGRLPDEALYALALYLQSLQPPPNPNPFDDRAVAGRTLFQREGCAGCHTAPLYTNNKLTLARGFVPPPDRPATLEVLPVTVGTDPGLALKTRKGTGYYKVPSLKGVWCRGHLLHDGSISSLEEFFNPARLQDTFEPSGWNALGVKNRAVPGHEFGLRLNAEDRKSLIAFLRTL